MRVDSGGSGIASSSTILTRLFVAAISSHFGNPAHPREVLLQPGRTKGLSQASAVILNQIRSIDRQRLLKRIGRVDGATLQRVDDALRVSLGLVDI
jgi:mRNA interferase MazF